jgi:hypothetical protein
MKMKMPGFTADASIEAKGDFYKTVNTNSYATERSLPNQVIPASAGCRRLLKMCVSGRNSRSYACDNWLLFC